MRRRFSFSPKYSYTKVSHQDAAESNVSVGILLSVTAICIFLAGALLFLKNLASDIAVSDASDVVTLSVNKVIADVMGQQDFASDYFVSFSKNESGEVSAISSNMSHINALSAEILDRVVGQTDTNRLTVSIPVGNLSGVSILMGRGFAVPIEIVMLTSSRVEFSNSIVTAGINQTKHQITLDVIVDIDVLIPWGKRTTQVVTDVLIADTVIVGKVPNTYLNMN